MKQKTTLLLMAAWLLAMSTYAQPGALDKSFAGNGLLRTLLGTSCLASDAKVQSNGKIVVAGQYRTATANNFLVERYNSDGTFDNTFAGGDGEQGINFGNRSEADAVAIQPDGKIVAVGSGRNSASSTVFVVVRLNTDGSADNTFATNGKQVLNNFPSESPVAVAIQTDGKILVAGSTPNVNGSSLIVLRLNANGSIDYTFAANGRLIMALNGQYPYYARLVIQPDGKIALACSVITVYVDHETCIAAVLRLNPNGTIDNTFGTNGIVYQSAGSQNYTMANGIALQSDNKIVVSGCYGTTTYQNTDFLVMRFNTDGTPDNSFAGNGRAGISFSHSSVANGIVVQPNGAIIAAGWVASSADQDFAMVRLLANGTPDPIFGSAGNGKVTTGFGFDDYATGLTLQPDGRILAFGASGNDMALARYLTVIKLYPARLMLTADSLQTKKAMLLYPNPAESSIMLDGLDAKSATQYSITDALGKTISSGKVFYSANTQINIAGLMPGTYFIQVLANGNVHTLQFVKR